MGKQLKQLYWLKYFMFTLWPLVLIQGWCFWGEYKSLRGLTLNSQIITDLSPFVSSSFHWNKYFCYHIFLEAQTGPLSSALSPLLFFPPGTQKKQWIVPAGQPIGSKLPPLTVGKWLPAATSLSDSPRASVAGPKESSHRSPLCQLSIYIWN